MKSHHRIRLLALGVAAASALPAPSWAQGRPAALALEEIVVTARRREERLQDVPITVNAVTAEEILDLNVRKLEDLQAVVAGLTLQEDTIAPNASLRGVRFDSFASGNNPTVEFYMDDAPVSSQVAMQALFDIQQVEVLRGPQGTLRGRASPSGSITITTQRPLLDAFEGYIDATINGIDGRNLRGAVNLPVVRDRLAVRLAGFWEENEINRVENRFTGDGSKYEGEGWRLSVAFQPLENLSLLGIYQKVEPDRTLYYPVESAFLADPSLPAARDLVRASDRAAVHDTPTDARQEQERLTLQLAWEFSGHALHYVFGKGEEKVDRLFAADIGNGVGPGHPATAWQGSALSQELDSVQDKESHEIRLQSSEPLFGRLDYVAGFFSIENDPVNRVVPKTPLAIFFPTPFGYVGPVAYSVATTPIRTSGPQDEKSWFANLTWHFTDATELSLGARRIDFEEQRSLLVGGNVLVGPGSPFDSGLGEWDTTIYSATFKHRFSDELMAYASYGTSWRPGINAVGDFSLVKSPEQLRFTTLDPEESESFELGVRSTHLDGRLTLNASAFYQEFDNYPYRSGGNGVYYVNYEAVRDAQGQVVGLNPTVGQFNFVAAVPVEVVGFELESAFQATDRWNLGGLFSYARGEIDSGTVPCNDYLPHDGIPDRGGVPTLADIQAAAGSANLTSCEVDYRANFAPLWTATLTSEYRLPLGAYEGYLRGLWTFFGKSKNDPANPFDDVDAYNLLNLYAGLRDPGGRWEAMLYVKNLFDVDKVTSRDIDPESLAFTGIDALAQRAVASLGGRLVSNYRQVALTPPQEVGLNLRVRF
ncbi:MAG: TonB-dependent receptor [Porticoccaceae bacterium]|nr:MAG: TonB-dependent receptor [Porticoccaceae bacterium]